VLLSVNVFPMTNAVEKHPVSFNVIANAVVGHPNPPLANRHLGQLLPLIGVGLERVEGRQHAPMHRGIKAAEIATEAIRDDELVTRHVRRASSPGVLWRGGPGADRLRWRPFRIQFPDGRRQDSSEMSSPAVRTTCR
jgi:hypothetical protein